CAGRSAGNTHIAIALTDTFAAARVVTGSAVSTCSGGSGIDVPRCLRGTVIPGCSGLLLPGRGRAAGLTPGGPVVVPDGNRRCPGVIRSMYFVCQCGLPVSPGSLRRDGPGS